MVSEEKYKIAEGVWIGPEDLKTVFSRSSGPGGQNVNKLSTRATVIFRPDDCPDLTDLQKRRISRALKGYVDKEGRIQISSQEHRSQRANRIAAMERLAELLRAALKPKKVRKKTRIPRKAVEKRLHNKKRRSQIKQLRSGKD